jgi:hypothetical protein
VIVGDDEVKAEPELLIHGCDAQRPELAVDREEPGWSQLGLVVWRGQRGTVAETLLEGAPVARPICDARAFCRQRVQPV